MVVKARTGTAPFVRWVLLLASLIAACGGSETISSTARDAGAGRSGNSGNAGARQDATGGGAGATGSAGTGASSGAAGSIGGDASGSMGSAGTAATGGSAGSAGAQGAAGMEGGTVDVRSPRRCGHGVPCAPGAECGMTGFESGSTCKCDPSGHFFCDIWAGGGAGGNANCPRLTGCAPPGSGGSAGADYGSCSLSNGYCTRNCVCPGGTCTMDCSGTGPPTTQGTVCDRSFCADSYWLSCGVKDGACEYSVACSIGATPTVTGRCD